MTAENAEVTDIDKVYIKPAGDDEENVDDASGDTDQDSSTDNDDETEDDTTDSDESDDDNKKPAALADAETTDTKDDGLEDVVDETPRERALRAEVTRLRTNARKERSDELLGNAGKPAPTAKKELDDNEKAVLGKYKPEEVAALKDIFPVLAKEMGFVRQDDLAGKTYADVAQDKLDGFLEKHPEYLPENDKEGTLWGAFKDEYAIYKQPENPRDFAKIFDKVHAIVFGIKPAAAPLKANAQREKTKVASHQGANSANRIAAAREGKPSASGLRTDMLKGFSAEEKAEMFGDE